MHKLQFKSNDGTITCHLTVKNSIPKEKLESVFKSLMLHMETSIGLYSNRHIFDSVTKIRGEFYTKVLKFLVDENLNNGQQVPQNILQHLANEKKPHWSFEDYDL
jgi:hypothetical protein